jgi:hypothetical protein
MENRTDRRTTQENTLIVFMAASAGLIELTCPHFGSYRNTFVIPNQGFVWKELQAFSKWAYGLL